MIIAKKLKEMVNFVHPFIGKAGEYCSYSYLFMKQKDNRLEVVATNGSVVARAVEPNPSVRDFEALVWYDNLKPILSKIPTNEYIQIEDFPDYLLIDKNMIEKLNTLSFVNYESLLRGEDFQPLIIITLDQSEIKQALKRLKVIAMKKITNVLEFHLDSGKLVLKCDNVDAIGEEIITSSSVQGKTDEEFLFNLNNIKKGIDKLRKGRLRMRYYNDIIPKPIYLTNEKRPSYEIIIAQLKRVAKKHAKEAIEREG